MAHKALIVWGGWSGHEPEQVSAVLDTALRAKGFETEVATTLDAFLDVDKLKSLNLIVPIWTMDKITNEQLESVTTAVKSGVGMGGVHGGMCDAFRESTEWQFMTGGQWVAHPGNDGVEYVVRITKPDHYITQGLADLNIKSEQYYMHTDPANVVLATTRFPTPGVDGPHVLNGAVDMPVVWTKMYGEGRIFYSSLGHVANVVAQPDVLELTTRGLLWAAKADA